VAIKEHFPTPKICRFCCLSAFGPDRFGLVIIDGPGWNEIVAEAEAGTAGPDGDDDDDDDDDDAGSDEGPPLIDCLLQGLQGVITVINATDTERAESTAAATSIVRRSAAATRARDDGVFPFLVVLVTQLDMVMQGTAQVVGETRLALRPVLAQEGWPETDVAFIAGSGTAPDAENMLMQALEAVIARECRAISVAPSRAHGRTCTSIPLIRARAQYRIRRFLSEHVYAPYPLHSKPRWER